MLPFTAGKNKWIQSFRRAIWHPGTKSKSDPFDQEIPLLGIKVTEIARQIYKYILYCL